MMGCRACILAIAATLALSGTSSAQESLEEADRVALVIGVGRYAALEPLASPSRDARAVAARLWDAGFQVIEVIDPEIQDLRAAIGLLTESLGPGSEVTIFFAGHGVQIGGENYLLATDVVSSGGENAGDLLAGAISANEMVREVAASGAEVAIVILDACRDNPLTTLRGGRDRSVSAAPPSAPGGLAPLTTPVQTEALIAFSTAPGAVAVDGPADGHSPFASALITHLQTPGLEVGRLFRLVRTDVRATTDGRQVPWVNLSLERDFFFREHGLGSETISGRSVDRIGHATPEDVLERTLWISALATNHPRDFETYLARYPNGSASAQAAVRLRALGEGDAMPEARPLTEADGPAPLWPGDEPVVLTAGTKGALPVPAPLTRKNRQVSAKVIGMPASVRLFGTDRMPLAQGALLDAEDLAGLSYETDTRTFGPLDALELELTVDGAVRIARIPLRSTISACDMLAGFRTDPERVGRGIRMERIEVPLATPVCESAVERYPENARLQAVLARVYRKDLRFEEARAWNIKALEGGSESAFGQDGLMKRLGLGGPIDYPGAVRSYARGAEMGGTGSMAALGDMYLRGEGVEKDEARGLRLIRAAASVGYDWAYALMGRNYELGYGVPQSYAEAVSWYRDGAEIGDVYSRMKLAEFYKEGLGVPRDPEAAFAAYQAAAGHGISIAQARLGRVYAEGEIVPRDEAAALHWYERSAAQGDLEGRFYLAEALLEGTGTEPDQARALDLLHGNAERDHVRSIALLADLHATGRAVPEDKAEARELHARALALGYRGSARPLVQLHLEAGEGARAVAILEASIADGDTWAMRDLARVLARGEGVAPDPVRSAALTRAAAEAGNDFARRDLARNLETGFGETGDPAGAFAAMEQAAEAGVAWARLDLARYYRDGVGTDPDPVAAAFWLAETTLLGDASANEEARDRLAATDPAACLAAIGLGLELRGFIARGPRADLSEHALDALTRLGRRPTSDTNLCNELLVVARAF